MAIGRGKNGHYEIYSSLTKNEFYYYTDTDGRLAGYMAKNYFYNKNNNQSYHGKTEIKMNRHSKKIKSIKK